MMMINFDVNLTSKFALKWRADTFKKLKQRVLWKFEDESLPGVPSNVMIKKWLPQNDILAHQNVVLFISHGNWIFIRCEVHLIEMVLFCFFPVFRRIIWHIRITLSRCSIIVAPVLWRPIQKCLPSGSGGLWKVYVDSWFDQRIVFKCHQRIDIQWIVHDKSQGNISHFQR